MHAFYVASSLVLKRLSHIEQFFPVSCSILQDHTTPAVFEDLPACLTFSAYFRERRRDV